MDDQRETTPPLSLLDPRIFVTGTLLVIQLSLVVAIAVTNGELWVVDLPTLAHYGALVRPLVWDDGQYWRLATAMFLHGGFFHFLLNGFVLLAFGGQVEIALGPWRYLLLYLAAGLTGNLASLLWGNAFTVSVGSSGALFGVVVVYLLLELRGPLPWTAVVRQRSTRTLFFFSGILLAVGFFLPWIDSWAHLGGALTGAAWGWLFVAPRDPERPALGRTLPVLVWLGSVTALALLAARPPATARAEVQMAVYYTFLQPDIARAAAHFDQAGRDPEGALHAIHQIAERLFAPGQRHLVLRELLELFDRDREAAAWYRQRPDLYKAPRHAWQLAMLLTEPATADSTGALAVCARAEKQFGRRPPFDWKLTEARIHATFLRYDQALATLAAIPSTTGPLGIEHCAIVSLCHVRRADWPEAERATSACLLALRHIAPEERGGEDLLVRDWRLRALEALGRREEAQALRKELEKEWRAAASKAPDHAMGWNNLAWFLATHTPPDDDSALTDAASLAQRSVERGPEAYNLDTLAWIEHLRGNPKAARKAIERALTYRRADTPEIHYHAGAILLALGRREEGRRRLERALQPGIDFEDYEAARRLLDQ